MKSFTISYGINKYSFYFIPAILFGYEEHAWIEHKRTFCFDVLFLKYYFGMELEIKHQNPE